MFDFDKHLSDLAGQTVLCIGDLMLDEFVYGEVSRISPEAPTPVIACKRSELMVGGAGNVARNLVALGARCIFVGVVGDDEAGRALTAALAEEPLIEFELVVDRGAPDHAQGALRLRASFDASAARRLGECRPGRCRRRGRADRPCASRRCRAPARWCCPTTPRAR